MIRRLVIVLGAVGLMFSGVGSVSAIVQYTVADLGTLPGYTAFTPYGINASGQVVGDAQVAGFAVFQAFYYNGSAMTGLPAPALHAYDINASGQIVGSTGSQAFCYSGGKMTYLQLPGGGYSSAGGINDNGQVVGSSDTASGANHAFLYSGGTMSDLSTLGGSSSGAAAINASGQIVGTAETASGYEHAFLYSSGTMNDLGTLGGTSSFATGINGSGQVVGQAYTTSGYAHGFLYSNATMQDLGTLPGGTRSEAHGINANGVIVGDGDTSIFGEHAFVYANGTMADLNSLISPSSGWTLWYANAINDSGWITASGGNGGNEHALLLIPINTPEPSTLALLGIGTVSLLAFAWRRRRGRVRCLSCAAVVATMLIAGSAQADVLNMGGTRNPTTGTWTGAASLQFVTVGDPGNAADTVLSGWSYTYCGSVPYVYQMGKYDVTVGQYCQFLNAVAATSDTYGLYNSYMASGAPYGVPTVRIAQSGASGNYSYSITGGYSQGVNCPIFDVSWGDAARFCNWLQNGQPTGAEGPGTTETGAYTLNGAVTDAALTTISRNTGATDFIPSENEWYKATYYKGGNGNAGYWTYPTQSITAPTNVLSSTGTNNANFSLEAYQNVTCTDPTNYLTPVGAFAASPGPYGTFDMGGDVLQWNEANDSALSYRDIRGGDWYQDSSILAANATVSAHPSSYFPFVGFRVASVVPEPGSIALLVAGGLCLLAYAWRRRRV